MRCSCGFSNRTIAIRPKRGNTIEFVFSTSTQGFGRLSALQKAMIDNGNVFDVLMDAVRVCSLGQITNALFEVGGQYRRNM